MGIVAMISNKHQSESNTTTSITLNPQNTSTEIETLSGASNEATKQKDVAPTPEQHWQSATVRAGDNLSALFARNRLSAADALLIAKASKEGTQMKPGQTIRWATQTSDSAQDRPVIDRLEILLSPLQQHNFSRTDDDTFIHEFVERQPERQPKYASATIENSLFLDGNRAGIPQKILIRLAGIFGWDIDFAQDIRSGDRFELMYNELYLDGEKMGNGEIIAARFTNKGRTFTAIRYEDEKGNAQYYTPKGLSMRKEFLRNPIDFARISSRFSLGRKHPILNRIRAHKGTDYAAAIGTPIKSTGDGRVIFSGRKGGYGNVVVIKHGSRYETRYAHLSKFNRKAKRGMTVKQGQIVGYVGMTGLATGPHLHYEFRVDGVHRDSLRIRLPKSQSISKSRKSAFLEHARNTLYVLDQHHQAKWQ